MSDSYFDTLSAFPSFPSVFPELVPDTEPPGKAELFVPVLPVLLEPPVVPEFPVFPLFPVFPESPLFSESVELRSAIFFIVSDWKVSILSYQIPFLMEYAATAISLSNVSTGTV